MTLGPFRDGRYALRTLARTPALTAVVVLTLALAIGAVSAVFSAIDAVLLKPLPFPDAERLMRLQETQADGEVTGIAPVRLEDWSRLNSTFEAITSYYLEGVSDTTGDVPEWTQRATVAPRFLEAWGIAPLLGRGFIESDHRGIPAAVMISERYWRNRLGADPNVLNRHVRIGETSQRIVGVLPASFLFLDRGTDLWFPASLDAPFAQARELRWYTGIGRLKAGVTPEQARADLAVVQAGLAEQYPTTDRDIGVRIEPFKEQVAADSRGSLWLVFGAATLLLLIACTNIATLLLTRAAERGREISVRLSLGASRARVAWQAFVEAAVLGITGAAIGLLVAAGASKVLRTLGASIPRIDEITLDGRVLLFTLVCVVLVTILCGLLPALRCIRADLASALASAGRGHVSVRRSLHWPMVGTQVALSVALLAGAGVLIRSLDELARVDAGFDRSQVLTFRLSGSFAETRDFGTLQQRIANVLDELVALPGVDSAATSLNLPGTPQLFEVEYSITGAATNPDTRIVAEERAVSPGYFTTLGIPFLEGVPCRSGAADNRELIVNRSFVDRYLRGSPAVGSRITSAGPMTAPIVAAGTIAGVVGDVRERGIHREPAPTVYLCINASFPTVFFLVRTRADHAAIASAIRRKVKELEPLKAVYNVASLDEQIGDAFAENRMRTIVLASFAATALALACFGIYGTLSYLASLGRREVGLRVALGALRRNIVAQFLLEALRVVALACVAGLALAAALGRMLSGMLFAVSENDPLTLASVIAIVVAVGALAALLPAMRAARIEPMRVLREE